MRIREQDQVKNVWVSKFHATTWLASSSSVCCASSLLSHALRQLSHAWLQCTSFLALYTRVLVNWCADRRPDRFIVLCVKWRQLLPSFDALIVFYITACSKRSWAPAHELESSACLNSLWDPEDTVALTIAILTVTRVVTTVVQTGGTMCLGLAFGRSDVRMWGIRNVTQNWSVL